MAAVTGSLTLENAAILWVLPLLALFLILLAWRRRFRAPGALVVRLMIAALLLLALARPVRTASESAVEEKQQERRVMLVDQSASMGAAAQELRAAAARLVEQSTAADQEVLYFSDRAILATTPGAPNPASRPLNLDPHVTDLANALSTGARLLKDRPGRLVLLSDGVPTRGDTGQALAQLVQAGVPVDVLLPAGQTRQPEIRVVDVGVPPLLREGETFNVEIRVHSTLSTNATLRLTQDQAQLAESQVPLEPGLNLFTFEASGEGVGTHTFNATVTPADSGPDQVLNNSLAAYSRVYAAPQVLLVSESLAPAIIFARQLDQAGFTPHRITPAELPDRLSPLEPYAGMVMLDVSARSLRFEQMVAVQEFVQSLGRGLLVTGGRNSFSLGHYEGSPLAEMLPVSMEPPPREERPPVALLLLIDHSGSMVMTGTPSKLALAKEAAIRATGVLGPEDLIGVLMFDDQYEWIVPFQHVGEGADLLDLQQAIARIPAGGGTHILEPLTDGLETLAQQDAASNARHAVLFTDGRSFDAFTLLDRYQEVVDTAQREGVTLSTIAIGIDADVDLLSMLAERGAGRYHFARTAEELPELTIAESDILRSQALQEGEFRAAVFMPHPVLRGLFPALDTADTANPGALPHLQGYIGLTPRPRAETALQVGPGDPLLSVWGYGLGRVAAWTSDTGADWTAAWRAWPQAGRFWGQVLGYTLPAPDLGLLQVQVDVETEGIVTLTAEGLTATGETVDLARTSATLTTPEGREVELDLLQVAPGRYQQRLRLPDAGAYRLTVTQARDETAPETVNTGFVVPYPAEFALAPEGSGEALLREIAAATGGRVLTGAALDPLAEASDAPSPGQGEPAPLWPVFLLLALLLWPVEIAWRRWKRLRIQ